MSEPVVGGDNNFLASFEKKLQLVRDRVVGAVEGYNSGVYIWGRGGTGKSYTVE